MKGFIETEQRDRRFPNPLDIKCPTCWKDGFYYERKYQHFLATVDWADDDMVRLHLKEQADLIEARRQSLLTLTAETSQRLWLAAETARLLQGSPGVPTEEARRAAQEEHEARDAHMEAQSEMQAVRN